MNMYFFKKKLSVFPGRLFFAALLLLAIFISLFVFRNLFLNSNGGFEPLLSDLPAPAATPEPPKFFLGAYSFEIRNAEGRFDSSAMVDKFSQGNINFYNYLVWHMPTDWDDLPEFLKRTAGKNVTVIADIVPPWGWDKRRSDPYLDDFAKWGEEFAKLSLQYPHFVGYTIDDWYFISSLQPENTYPSFAKRQMDAGRDAARKINPDFKFYPTVYTDCEKGMDKNFPVDGVLLYPDNVASANDLPDRKKWKEAIASCKKIFPEDTFVGIYSVTAAGNEQKNAADTTLRDADIVSEKINLALEQSPRGVVIYGLQWQGTVWDRVAEIFKQKLPPAGK